MITHSIPNDAGLHPQLKITLVSGRVIGQVLLLVSDRTLSLFLAVLTGMAIARLCCIALNLKPGLRDSELPLREG